MMARAEKSASGYALRGFFRAIRAQPDRVPVGSEGQDWITLTNGYRNDG